MSAQRLDDTRKNSLKLWKKNDDDCFHEVKVTSESVNIKKIVGLFRAQSWSVKIKRWEMGQTIINEILKLKGWDAI